MRIVVALCAALAMSVPCAAFSSSATSLALVDSADLGTPFIVTSPTAIPGKTLEPGTYSITVVDHLTDRVILRIEGPKGKVKSTFIAVANPELKEGVGTGPIAWSAGAKRQHPAMRGFAFPGGNTVEFVYPKAEAVSLAKVNSAKVPAIDPESDDRKLANKKLSASDLQLLTLWTLAATRVGPNDSTPAIQAERYRAATQMQPAEAQTQQSSTPLQVASAEMPHPAFRQQQARANAPSPRRQRIERSAGETDDQSVPQNHKTSIESLPQTASNLPLVLLAGGVLLLGASLLRGYRVRRSEQ